MGSISFSAVKHGLVGFHLIINPRSSVPPDIKLHRRFLRHGLTLRNAELRSILSGRKDGVDIVNAALRTGAPFLKHDTRLKLSGQIIDTLLNRNIEGLLSQEAPTFSQKMEQRQGLLKHLINRDAPQDLRCGPVPELLCKIPAGLSLTIHF